MNRRQKALFATGACIALAGLAATGLAVTRERAPRAAPAGTLHIPAPQPTTSTAPASYPIAPPATVSPAPIAPARLSIDTIGVDATVVPVGVVDGTNEIEVPPLDQVGWYEYAATPGDAGSAVLLGHVDGGGRPGVFYDLGTLEPGTTLEVELAGDVTRSFRVIGRAQFPKSELPADLFDRAGPARLVLITCGGDFDSTRRHYRDNVVVVAEPA